MMISVCIPVYNTEKYLKRCLESVVSQDFDSFEIIIVSDNSQGRDQNNWPCHKIVKKFKKQTKIPIKYLENSTNLGTLEVRRTLSYEARGEYIFFLDSDDFLPPNALKTLYNTAKENNADIVHGKLTSGYIENEAFIPDEEQKLAVLYTGTLQSHDIFTKTFVEQKDAMIICSKLIKTELILKAYEEIPFCFCTMSEDYLLFFFISLMAHNFIGIDTPVYNYVTQDGISSTKTIKTIEECKKICSVSSVFVIIHTWLTENPKALSEKEIDIIRKSLVRHLYANYTHLEYLCAPEIKEEAMKLLEEYWGKSLVNLVKNSLNQTNKE